MGTEPALVDAVIADNNSYVSPGFHELDPGAFRKGHIKSVTKHGTRPSIERSAFVLKFSDVKYTAAVVYEQTSVDFYLRIFL